MRILMVTNMLSEGGVETLLLDLCRSLVNFYYHDVAVLVLNKNEIGLKKQFEACGVKVFVGKYSNIYNPFNIFLIKSYAQSYQIIHVHLFPGQLFAVLAKLLCGFSRKASYITTEHNTFNNRRKYSILKFLDSYIYSKFDDIICISKPVDVKLREWLGRKSADNIRTINNGIDIEKFHKSSNGLGQYIKEQNAHNIQYLVMVGRFEHPKDQLTIIKAMMHLPDKIHLILVGSGSTLQQCKDFANEKELSQRIHFFGNCNNIPSILKGCKIGVLSTYWDGFGLVAVEYMAAGIPVIASDVEGLKDVIGRKDLLFKVGDVDELKDRILWLLDDSNAYQEMKEYCMVTSFNYTLQKMVAEYINVYQEALIKIK